VFLERRHVSRKTPRDGRLDITKDAAAMCGELGAAFDVDLAGRRSAARLVTMGCTCRGLENPHVHYFIESEALKALAPGDDVDLAMDPTASVVHIAPLPREPGSGLPS
jgi:hypothetical protein